MSTLGERIKEARKGKKISAPELANIIGANKSTISLYERDMRRPMEAVLMSIAAVTGVNFRWLNSGQGDMYGEAEDIRSVEDERILRGLSPKERALLLKFLELDAGDRKNIRVYLEGRVDAILQRKMQTDEEGM